MNYYVQVLQEEFRTRNQTRSPPPSKLAIFISQSQAKKKVSSWTHEPWKDFPSPVQLIQAKTDTMEHDAHSHECEGKHIDQEHVERNAEAVFHRVLRFSRISSPVSKESLTDLIESTYAFQTDLRSQVAFGSCFNRHFPADVKGAARARRALLFLSKFHAAVSTFVETAKFLPSFRKISFPQLEADSVPPQTSSSTAAETSPSTIYHVLRTLGLASSYTLVEQRFQRKNKPTKDIDKEFNTLRCERRRVHAEIQLVYDYETRQSQKAGTGRVHPYIGSSKLCCYLCWSFLRRHIFFGYRGCHWKIYHRWLIPFAFADHKARRKCSNISGRSCKEKTNLRDSHLGPRQRSIFLL